MNVEDFNVEIPEGDMLEIIFNHQRDLMDKYHPVEEKIVGHYIPSNCSHESVEISDGEFRSRWQFAGALNIQDRANQSRFKDFAWRITEELTEATLSLEDPTDTHYLEELIDALHFSVELIIMCGLFPLPDQKRVGDISDDRLRVAFSDSKLSGIREKKLGGTYSSSLLKSLAYAVVEKLGEAMNRLKLKPWKATPMQTDERAFHQSMAEFFAALIDLLKASGFTAETATKMYLNKNAVNQFRINSNY